MSITEYSLEKAKDMLVDNHIYPHEVPIFKEVGSTMHGISVGSDDLDLTAVRFEGWAEFANYDIKRQSMMIRTAPEGERSWPGDIDLNVYTVRKYASLLLNGNPSILAVHFSPENVAIADKWRYGWLDWDSLHDAVKSKKAGAAFLGYMRQQYERWRGNRGQKNVNRPELVEQYGFDCYADDTEFLTRSGWKTYENIADSEEVGTVNQTTGTIEFQVPVERVAKDVTDQLVDMTGQWTHCLVTKNHRMWVNRAHRTATTATPTEWEFRTAKSLIDEAPGSINYVRTGFENHQPSFNVTDDELQLIGAYVSEGSVGKSLSNGTPSVLCFSQYSDGRLAPCLRSFVEKFNGKLYEYDRRPAKRSTELLLTIADVGLVSRIVRDCGEGSHAKKLPPYFTRLNQRQARLVLETMIAGDGTEHRSGGWVYYTISEQLAGDTQAIAMLAGYRATQWGPYDNGMYHVRIQEADTVQQIRGTEKVSLTRQRNHRVVCFTVSNEVLVTRRKGKVAIQGNTKYAGHLIRLGLQGKEYLDTGRLTLPMPEREAGLIRDIRSGEYTETAAVKISEKVEADLMKAYAETALPSQPDREGVRLWVSRAYHRYYRFYDEFV